MTLEQTKNEQQVQIGPAPFSDEFQKPQSEGRVEVVHGLSNHSLPFVGMTAGQAKSELADLFHIDPNAQAIVDGHEVGDDVILQEGQVLTFLLTAGEKG